MTKINIITISKKKENKEITDKVYELVKSKNELIANDFKMKPLELDVKLFESTEALCSNLGPNKDSLGIFSGYLEGTNEILLINPLSAEGLFTNLWKEMGIIIDLALVKFYLCKKYFPKPGDFKLYHKYISQTLSEIVSGKYNDLSARFDFKMHSPSKRYKKDKELGLIFYIMKKHSGVGFIFENLDLIMKDLDIKKSINTIYKKNLDELIKPEQDKIIEEDKKLAKTFKRRR